MEKREDQTVDFDVDDVCRRFSAIYTGAISDVLDEMGHRNQVLPSSIQALTMDQSVAGIVIPVEGGPTDSTNPKEVYVPSSECFGISAMAT